MCGRLAFFEGGVRWHEMCIGGQSSALLYLRLKLLRWTDEKYIYAALPGGLQSSLDRS